MKRAADDLHKTFIAPAADGRSVDLVDRQNQVVGKVEQAIKAQSSALSNAADEILSRPAVVPVRFVPLSTAEAVLQYATDFLPSWAGAISLDLMPAVLIFIHVIVHAAIRREEGVERDEDSVTAGDVMRAVRIYHTMRDHDPSLPHPPKGGGATLESDQPGAPPRLPPNVSSITPPSGPQR